MRFAKPRQAGFALVEVLIASAIVGVALVVLLGVLGSVLIGARVAERKVVEGRLARNAIEAQMSMPFPGNCQAPRVASVDGVPYTTSLTCTPISAVLVEYSATVRDASGAGMVLKLDRAKVQ